MSPLDVDRTLATAALAGLQLSREEAERFAPQLERILAAFERLQRLDLAGVAPLASPLERCDVLRDDEPRAGLDREALLDRAPRHEGGFFCLPRTLGAER